MGSAAAPQLFTVTDVEPGDVLTAIEPAEEPSFGTVDVTVDGVPAGVPVGNLRAWAGPCASSLLAAPPLNVSVYSECQVGGAFPLLVTAHDTGTGAELGFTHKKANSILLADGGVTPSMTLQPTTAWSTAMTSQMVSVSKSPAAQNGGSIFYNEFVGGVAHYDSSGFSADPDAGTQAATFIGHPGYADFVQTTAQIRQYTAEGAITAIATRAPTPTMSTSTTIDLSTLLPLITNVTFDSTTPARPVVGWTAAGSLAAADGQLVVIRWSAADGDGGTVSGSWSLVTSPAKTSVTFPALPPSASPYQPSATATFGPTPLIAAFEATFIPSYAALRAVGATLKAPEELFPSTPYGGIIPALPAAGTLRATAWTHDND